MKTKILTLLLLVISASAFAQIKYPVSEIPDSLKNNANAIVRDYSYELKVSSTSKATLVKRVAITILSEKDKEYSIYVADYTPFVKFSSFKGIIYDSNGKQVKKIKESDLLDRSYSEESTLFEELRLKLGQPNYPIYPYTVEYETTYSYSGIQYFTDWVPYVYSNDISVQKASLKVTTPKELGLRLKGYNLKGKIEADTTSEVYTYSYSTQGLMPYEEEPLAPSSLSYQPRIVFGLKQYDFDGHSGKLDTWENMSNSLYDLLKGRDDISPRQQEQMARLKGKPVREIVDSVRSYLDKNTRYVSIQVGIGGWQPLKASMVERTGIGDCKALANFGHSLLKAAGVESYSTCISVERNGMIDKSFTNDRFDHVILCIPNVKDTIWLDCTCPKYNLGYIPIHDGGRYVLPLKENGSLLSKTPKYGLKDNIQNRTIDFSVDDEGNVKGNIVTEAKNNEAEGILDRSLATAEEQRKSILEQIPFSNPMISNLKYHNYKTSDLKIKESYSVEATKFGSLVGKRLFLPLVALERIRNLPKLEKRKTMIVKPYSFINSDTIRYSIPNSYLLPEIPTEQKIESQFGKYSLTIKKENNTILAIRTYEIFEGVYAPEKYKDIYEFYRKMSSLDNGKLILIKNEQ